MIEKVLTPIGAQEYLEQVVEESRRIYGSKPFRVTEPEPDVALELAREKGNFVLCIIPPEYLEGLKPGNVEKANEVLNYVENESTLGVKPIMVEDYNGTLITIDGKTRAWASKELNRPILGYIPTSILEKLPKARRLDHF